MPQSLLSSCHVVLVAPMFGGNVGAAARAIANCGLGQLRLVRPQYTDELEARKFCHGAEPVYEARQNYEGLADAVHGCRVVAGFSARERHRRRYVALREFAEAWVADALAQESAAQTALLFGPERDGLSNDDLNLCSDLVWIPAHPQQPSYNLAQAVLLAGYELLVAQLRSDPEAPRAKPRMTRKPPLSHRAPAEEIDELLTHLRSGFLAIGYAQEHTIERLIDGYREIFARAGLYSREAQMLRGLAQQLEWVSKRSRDGN
jgi:tRNA/rRNA methyltransferase